MGTVDEQMDTGQSLEDVARESQLDYVMIYSNANQKEAEDMCDRLAGLGMKGCLYDDTEANSVYFASQANIVMRSTFKFVLVTENFAYDAEEDPDLLTHKNEALVHSIQSRDQTVIPIWLTPRNKLPKVAALYGLMSLTGLDPNRAARFDRDVKKLLEMPMFQQMKEERIQNLLKQPKHQIKQEVKGPDGNTIVNIINVDKSSNIVVNFPAASGSHQSHGVAPTPILDKIMSYEAPASFWQSFESTRRREHRDWQVGPPSQAWVHDGPESSFSASSVESRFDQSSALCVP